MSASDAPVRLPIVLTRDIIGYAKQYLRGSVLDVGAGSAKYKKAVLAHASAYTAFDMIEGPGIDVVGDVHALPFPDNTFDTVICNQVLEHVNRPWEVVAGIQRVLKPGGHCIITAPFLVPYHADPDDYYRYTTQGGAFLCERAGLKVIERIKYGGLPIVAAETFKFTFCNHYIHKNPGFLRRNIFRVVYGILCRMQSTTRQDTHIYANMGIIAQKPA